MRVETPLETVLKTLTESRTDRNGFRIHFFPNCPNADKWVTDCAICGKPLNRGHEVVSWGFDDRDVAHYHCADNWEPNDPA